MGDHIKSDPKKGDAAREARNKYYRDYRARNPEKIREINRRYWDRKAKQGAEHNAKNEAGR